MSRNTALSMTQFHAEGYRWIAQVLSIVREALRVEPDPAAVGEPIHRRIEGAFVEPYVEAQLEKARHQLALHNAGAWLW
jgi:hypothetical protein